MAGLIGCDAGERLPNERIARLAGLVRRLGRGVGFVHAALHRVVDSERLERTHGPVHHHRHGRLAAMAAGETGRDLGMAPLIAHRAVRIADQAGRGAVTAQLREDRGEGGHGGGLHVRHPGEVLAEFGAPVTPGDGTQPLRPAAVDHAAVVGARLRVCDALGDCTSWVDQHLRKDAARHASVVRTVGLDDEPLGRHFDPAVAADRVAPGQEPPDRLFGRIHRAEERERRFGPPKPNLAVLRGQ